MKCLRFLCLAGWLVAGVAGAQPAEPKSVPLTKEQQERLKERDQFSKDARKLWTAGKWTEAMAVAEKMLAIDREVFGDVHHQVAESLQLLARMHTARDDFPAARRACQEILAIQTKLLGARHWKVTDARIALEDVERLARLAPADRRRLAEAGQLNRQVRQLYQQGKSREALPPALKVAQIRKEVLGERHPAYARSLQNLAELYQEQGDYAEAESLHRRALEIRKEVLGQNHHAYADSLIGLALLHQSRGEYTQAEPLYRQALEIHKQALGPWHPDYATSLSNLANLYQAEGDYTRAEPLCRQALGIRKKVLGERHLDYAASLNNLAVLYTEQGEYTQAEALYFQAAEIIKQVLGERHPQYAQTLNNLAVVYRSQGEYAKAEPLYRKTLEVFEQVGGKHHADYVGTLSNLAVLYQDEGEYAKAESLFRQARDLRKQMLGERHPAYAESLHNLAALFQAQGKYTQAETLHRQAAEIYRQVLGERHPAYARSQNNLALLAESQGEFARAESLYRQVIVALRQRPDGPPTSLEQVTAADLRASPDAVIWLGNYCVFLEQQLGPRPTAARLRAADHAFALALAVRERLRQEVLEHDTSKLWHGAQGSDLIPRRLRLCQRLFEQEGRVADLETALATAEQGSARVFLEQLGKARALAVGQVSPELREQEAAFRHKLRELDLRVGNEQDKPSDKRDPERLGQLRDEQNQVEAQLNALIRRMERDYPQYAALKYPKPCTSTQARACLAANEVALLFILGFEKSYVVLVEARPAGNDKANGLAIHTLPSAEELAEGISCLTMRETFEHPGQAHAVGVQAYDLLLAPLKDRLRGKDLVIVAGGPLAYLPFEALREDGHYLIEQHRIRYAPSLTALHLVRLWEQTRTPPTQPLWALGDPVYDPSDVRLGVPAAVASALGGAGVLHVLTHTELAMPTAVASASRDPLREVQQREGSGRGNFRRLKHSGDEVRAIAKVLQAPSGAILTDGHALEAEVKAASASGLLARVRYVHFATHGILGLDTGQPPALVLSLVGNDGQHDADGGVNDGFLRLDEVTRLKLNADLVVLSACETGKGRLYAGEGVTGLARAFLYAGSRGVVASLWAVDDRETAALMTRLYTGLKDGKPTADALRAAKLEMIQAGKAPVYWAPFILIGE
jgi:CHAT domain-containing protein/tetratricopeptide (TPR) repeat protein